MQTETLTYHEDRMPVSLKVGCLSLKVQSQDGNEVFFQVKNTIKLGKMFEAYCKKVGIESQYVKFLFDGVRLGRDDTPLDMEMEDEDKIDAFVTQTGGGGDKKIIVELWNPKKEKTYNHVISNDSTIYYIGATNKRFMIRCKVDASVTTNWVINTYCDGKRINYIGHKRDADKDGYVYFRGMHSIDHKLCYPFKFTAAQDHIEGQEINREAGIIKCTLYAESEYMSAPSDLSVSQQSINNFDTTSKLLPLSQKVGGKFYNQPGLVSEVSKKAEPGPGGKWGYANCVNEIEEVIIRYDSAERLALRQIITREHPSYPPLFKRNLPPAKLSIPPSLKNKWCDLVEDDDNGTWSHTKRLYPSDPIDENTATKRVKENSQSIVCSNVELLLGLSGNDANPSVSHE